MVKMANTMEQCLKQRYNTKEIDPRTWRAYKGYNEKMNCLSLSMDSGPATYSCVQREHSGKGRLAKVISRD